MGKARKETDAPLMRARLEEAFWSLLETKDLHDITVGDLVERAGCNRGSFYYYYDTREEFLDAVVREGFLGSCGLQDFLIDLVCGNDPALPSEGNGCDRGRFLLLVRHGGLGLVAREVRDRSVALWSAVLRPDGGTLRAETAEIVEFLVGGIVGVFAHLDANAKPGASGAFRDYLATVCQAAIESIARAEGTLQDEILARLKTLGQYRKMSGQAGPRRGVPARA